MTLSQAHQNANNDLLQLYRHKDFDASIARYRQDFYGNDTFRRENQVSLFREDSQPEYHFITVFHQSEVVAIGENSMFQRMKI